MHGSETGREKCAEGSRDQERDKGQGKGEQSGHKRQEAVKKEEREVQEKTSSARGGQESLHYCKICERSSASNIRLLKTN